MKYAKVENQKVVKGYETKPDWWNGDPNGEGSRPLTDDELLTHGVYPVVENPPDYDPIFYVLKMNHPLQWNVLMNTVEVTYYIGEYSLEEARPRCLADLDRQEITSVSNGIIFHGGIFSPNPDNLSDIASLKDAVAIGMSVLGPYPYEFKDRYWVELNASDIDLLIANAHEFLNQLWGNKKNKQTEIQNATSLEDLKAIDLNITIGG